MKKSNLQTTTKGTRMLKKGLVALVCLTVMSALWSWAAGTYQIQTTLSGAGGSLVLDNGTAQTTGSLFKNYTTTTRSIPVTLTVDPAYKIKTLTVNGVSKMAFTSHSTAFTGTFNKTTATVQSLSATLVQRTVTTGGIGGGTMTSSAWQLQTQNANAGGKITTTRNGVNVVNSGLTAVFQNYTGTAALTAVVKADTGYLVSAVTTTGTAVITGDTATVTGIPSSATKVNVITASYKKAALAVTADTGIQASTLTPVYGTPLLLVITPTAPKNVVSSVSITGNPALTDVNGNSVTLPYIGTVKAYIPSVTSNITATATFALDTKSSMAAQCNTCHLSSTVAATLNSYPNWAGSQHAAAGVDCITCHASMPGTVIKENVTPGTFAITAAGVTAGVGTLGADYCATCHATAGGAVIDSEHNAAMKANCAACHTFETHSLARTAVAGSTAVDHVAASATVCSSCHTTQRADFASANNPHVARVGGHFTQGCAGCHAPTLAAPTTTVCTTCHAGAYGIQTTNWTASTHNIANNHFEDIGCSKCHNAHATEAGVGNVPLILDGKTDACAQCHVRHTTAQNYSLYSSNGVMRTPHGGGVPSYMGGTGGAQDNVTKAGWPAAQTSYMTRGAICSDCHGHNNTINAGFAEGGHGAVSTDALNAWVHYDWSKQTNNGTRQNGNCDRCHTAGGFMKFLGLHDNDAIYARYSTGLKPLASTAYNANINNGQQANNVLTCVACHTNPEGNVLRISAAPSGNNAAGKGAGQALSAGYFALFSSSKSYGASGFGAAQGPAELDKTKIQIAFPAYKNSSICVPCHAGRSTAAVFTTVIARANADLKNYSTVITSYYQHAANMGQTFQGVGAYDFTGKLAAIGASSHAAVKNDTADTQGPCVGCHYSKTGADHSLEVVETSPTCINTGACHTDAPNVAAAEANFNAGVAALDALIRVKMNPLRIDATLPLETERGYVRFGRFGKNGAAADAATATAAYGAWYNWQILATYDKAAFVHNPRYARQILNDTLAYLNGDGAAPGAYGYTGAQVQAAIAAGVAAAAAQATPVTVDAAAANSFITAPGCTGCHSDKVADFATAFHNTQLKFSCATCHSETHITGAVPACLHCHSALATSEHASFAGFTAADNSACVGCHSDHAIKPVSTQDFSSVVANGQTSTCDSCHARFTGTTPATGTSATGAVVVQGWYSSSAHSTKNCSYCHTVTPHGATSAALPKCVDCHMPTGTRVAEGPQYGAQGGVPAGHPTFTGVSTSRQSSAICAGCHNLAKGASAAVNPHAVDFAAGLTGPCLFCHSKPTLPIVGGSALENAGVRQISVEFAKKSHHIYQPLLADGTTVDPLGIQSKHCIVCHKEGEPGATAGSVEVNAAVHLQGVVALRNADDNTQISWSGSEFAAMDNFCMACHDDNGAAGIATVLANVGVQASALNPFGDKISNGYDLVARNRVVNVFSAFSTGNMSHHAVRGPRYNARTTADAVTAGLMVNSAPNADKYAPKSQAAVNGQETLYTAGLFTDYTPQGAALSVADNSQLHCGDCHTVGQLNYGPNAASAGNSLNKVAIGAHGSANDYMLRNNSGTDTVHTKQNYVCFNCHNNSYNGYLSTAGVTYVNSNTGVNSGYYNGSGGAGRANHGSAPNNCQIETTTAIGSNNTLAGNRTYGSGNITGISCTNCHNSGRTGFGGIHGGNGNYKTGWVQYTSASRAIAGTAPATYAAPTTGTTAKLNPAVTSIPNGHYRFMGGMGNYGYKPFGGGWNWDGGKPNGTYTNINGTVSTNQANGDSPLIVTGATSDVSQGGCYTNLSAGDNAGWSSCVHHSTANGSAIGSTPNAQRRSSVGHIGRPLQY
jgi:hypothetical protein